jgi:hypothetical protein
METGTAQRRAMTTAPIDPARLSRLIGLRRGRRSIAMEERRSELQQMASSLTVPVAA